MTDVWMNRFKKEYQRLDTKVKKLREEITKSETTVQYYQQQLTTCKPASQPYYQTQLTIHQDKVVKKMIECNETCDDREKAHEKYNKASHYHFIGQYEEQTPQPPADEQQQPPQPS